MRLDEINTRLADIKELLKTDGEYDIDTLTEEVRSLKDEKKAILDEAIEIRNHEDQVANDETLEVINSIEFTEGEQRTMENINMEMEYRNAYWKTLAGEELTENEQRAFTHTTANSTGVILAKTDADQIFSLIEEAHPLLNDITVYRTGTVLELTKHTAIVAGDAKSVAEGVANDDEQNTFVKVTLSGKDFSKHVEVSYALGKMNAVNLAQYLIGEIADRLGVAIAEDIYAEIIAGMAAANKKTSAAAKVTTYKELVSIFALLSKAKATDVYVNNATLYNYIVSLEDLNGRPLFQPNMQDGIQGYLLGARVKLEDAVADNVILVGEPKQVVGNFVQEPMIEADKDIKRHVDIYAGYARFEAELMNDKAFAQLTIKQS